MTVSASQPDQTPETTITTNAEFLTAIFRGLQADERPMVVCIVGAINDKTKWPTGWGWTPAGVNTTSATSNWYFTLSTYKPKDGDYRRRKDQFCRAFGVMLYGHTPHIDTWDSILTSLERKSGLRNRIAHGQHILNVTGAPGRRWGIVDWEEKEPVRVSKKGVATLVSSALCLASVATARAHFRRLTGELASLQAELHGRPPLPPVFLGPEPDATDSRNSVTQIRQALGMQPRPSRARLKQKT